MDVTAAGQAFNNMASAVSELQKYLQSQQSRIPSAPSGSGSVSVQIPPFSGSEQELANIWILQAEEAFAAKNVPPEKKVSTAVLSLSGGALSWYLAAKDSLKEASKESDEDPSFIKWQNFSEQLKKAFPIHNEQVQLRKMLRNLRQTGRVSEYTAKFRVLYGLTKDMAECDALLNYTEGLKPETKAEVDYNSPETLHDAIDIASKYDAAFHCRPSPQRYFSYLNHSSKPLSSHPNSGETLSERDYNQEPRELLDEMEIDNVQSFSRRPYPISYRGRFRGRPRAFGRGKWGRAKAPFGFYRGPYNPIQKRASTEEKRRKLQRELDFLNNACYNCHQTGHNSYDTSCPKNQTGRVQNVEYEPSEN